MKNEISKFSIAAGTAVLVAAGGVSPTPVQANGNGPVSPVMVQVTLAPGESHEVEKTIIVPESPPKLDVCLLVDLSGSYSDDLPNIKSLMPGIWDDIKADIPDSRFCLGTFVDFPFEDWGSENSGDYAYSLDQGLTPDKTTWTDAVDAMTTKNGGDVPESQYEALSEMATGSGNDVPPTGPSFGDVPSGGDPAWRVDATRVVMITTDASFHVNGDSNCTGRDSSSASDCPFPYPGPTAAAATQALVDAGIKVIALKAPGSGAEMDALAAATGGSVQTTDSTSSDIADAILAAFEELTFDITGNPEGCDPLGITFDPTSHEDVLGGETVLFDETITVPTDVTGGDLDEHGELHCTVDFKADDTLIGTQAVWVTVQREVDIDIKPGSFPNSINMKRSTGVIPVAVLGSDIFDVVDIDVTTLKFGPGKQVPAHDLTNVTILAEHTQDVNIDAYWDLVSHYVIDGTGIVSGDTEACIYGKTDDGINFTGCDSVLTRH